MHIRNFKEFRAHAAAFDEIMTRYGPTALGRRKLSGLVRRDLLDRRNGRLLSANAPARIAFAREAAKHVAHTVSPSRSRQAFFLSLYPDFGRRRAAELERSPSYTHTGRLRAPRRNFNDVIEKMREWASRELGGTSFFGVVEVAYYTRHPSAQTEGPIFSFHAHIIVWDTTAAEVDAVAERVTRSHRGIAPGLEAAHVRSMNVASGVSAAALYALKPPMQEYGAYLRRANAVESVWTNQKRRLRQGDAARVAKVFAGVEIDQLCFNGGRGSGLIRTIAEAARARIRRDEQREEKAFERLRRGSAA